MIKPEQYPKDARRPAHCHRSRAYPGPVGVGEENLKWKTRMKPENSI